eukprot:12633520-Heterocapsa_arctica.AAC.1
MLYDSFPDSARRQECRPTFCAFVFVPTVFCTLYAVPIPPRALFLSIPSIQFAECNSAASPPDHSSRLARRSTSCQTY